MITAKDFNLKFTVESGQPLTFYSDYRQAKGAERLRYVTERGAIDLTRYRKSGRIKYDFSGKYSSASAEKEIKSRLGLDQDLGRVYGAIETDDFMHNAVHDFYGMRITKNAPWEATLCFVLSQFNNIKRIRKITMNLIERFGGGLGDGTRLFPTPESLAAARVEEIRRCGMGFRDKYIKHVAEQFSTSFDQEKLYGMKYEAAKERLMELNGVGDKVADCILLFGYGKFEAFPIDTWVKRVMERAYFGGKKRSIRQIHDFSVEKWGEYRGYAQQYIFQYGRENKMR